MDFHHIRDLLAQAIVLVVILYCFTLRLAHVSGVSMEPTVPADSIVVVSTLDYRFLLPRPGDVIAFSHDRMGPDTFIKRVIAVPDERVAEMTGHMVVDEQDIDLHGQRFFDQRTLGSVTVPPQSYFVVGDNRPHSDDSRHWGPVASSAIIGRVDAVIWPLPEMRIIR